MNIVDYLKRYFAPITPKRWLRLFAGFFLFAVSTVVFLNADFGLSPWDVFHQGISRNTGITIGQASITVGFVIIIFNYYFKEKVGIGTILNIIFIGLFIDMINASGIIPRSNGFLMSIVMIFIGILLVAIASWLYLGAELGSGPRDGLMLALQRRFDKPVILIRTVIEISALVGGYFLGGTAGIATVILSTCTGAIMQKFFDLVKFDTRKINHRFFDSNI